MNELILSQKTPKEIIKEFNSKTGKNLENNNENRKKISTLRSYKKHVNKMNKQAKDNKASQNIFNIYQLQQFIAHNTLSLQELNNIEPNTVFVCGNLQSCRLCLPIMKESKGEVMEEHNMACIEESKEDNLENEVKHGENFKKGAR